jgi:hypothetical protein
MTTETTSSTSFNEDDSNWAGADFFGLHKPRALHRFLGVCDSGDDGYELMWP